MFHWNKARLVERGGEGKIKISQQTLLKQIEGNTISQFIDLSLHRYVLRGGDVGWKQHDLVSHQNESSSLISLDEHFVAT